MKKLTITTGDLMRAFENMPPDTPIVIEGGSDHTYRTIRQVVARKVGLDGKTFYEWYGASDDNPDEMPVDAVVLEL